MEWSAWAPLPDAMTARGRLSLLIEMDLSSDELPRGVAIVELIGLGRSRT